MSVRKRQWKSSSDELPDIRNLDLSRFDADIGKITAGRGDPLCTQPPAESPTGPRQRASGTGQQLRGAGNETDCPWTKKLSLHGLRRRWQISGYGHRNVIGAVALGLVQSGSVDGYDWEVMREIEPELVSNPAQSRHSIAYTLLRRNSPKPTFVASAKTIVCQMPAMRTI